LVLRLLQYKILNIRYEAARVHVGTGDYGLGVSQLEVDLLTE